MLITFWPCSSDVQARIAVKHKHKQSFASWNGLCHRRIVVVQFAGAQFQKASGSRAARSMAKIGSHARSLDPHRNIAACGTRQRQESTRPDSATHPGRRAAFYFGDPRSTNSHSAAIGKRRADLLLDCFCPGKPGCWEAGSVRIFIISTTPPNQ